MAKTATYDALLTVCIQDLHKGEAVLRDALPDVALAANDPVLVRVLRGVEEGAASAADALAATGRHSGGASNLWMDGIIRDSRRDTTSIEPGPLLDAAIIGAIRKAKAAQIVSYDTAIAVAAALGQSAIVDTLATIRGAAVSISRRLANRLPVNATTAAKPSGNRPTPRRNPRPAARSRARSGSV